MTPLVHLEAVYGNQATEIMARIDELRAEFESEFQGASGSVGHTERWNEQDVVLITYGDQVQKAGSPTLQTFHEFLTKHKLNEVINTVHFLPFFPYSSDDGFSVIDYLAIDPNLGDWPDVAGIGEDFSLMFDFVVNHVSQHSAWYQHFLAGKPPYDRFFHVVDPSVDLSQVTRPRSLPLLTPAQTSGGEKHVWTTFSDDQIDVNFSEPDVIVEMTRVLLEYVRRGARIIRLDAIAYLWKEIGTSCIHLPQTHSLIKFLRALLDDVAPHVILLTETNVPHQENVSYFGDGDEAHMVYQFSLPPLLLDAVHQQDASFLMSWLDGLSEPPAGATYFNFTASHDGVGVRPLEGLIEQQRFDQLMTAIRNNDGLVSTRRTADGNDLPYELNVAYVDAVGKDADPDVQAKRFMATQAVMLSLRGVPGVYFHSLVGSQNDLTGVEASGQSRRINRRKYQLDEIDGALNDDSSLQSMIYARYRELLSCRIQQPAFHPDAPQRALLGGPKPVLAIERTSLDGGQRIIVLVNLGREAVECDVSRWTTARVLVDLISDESHNTHVPMEAYQAVWLDELL